jgi:hypothetical protein
VLVPWLELDPHAVLPGSGPVAGLLKTTPPVPGSTGPNWTGAVRRRPDLRLALPVPEAEMPCS